MQTCTQNSFKIVSTFGSPIAARAYASGDYRYGFNGKELDKDGEGMGGGGNTYDYGFRIYNPNLGRFLSVDPLKQIYPHFTPYQFAGNLVIVAIDIDGLESKIIIQETQADGTVKLVSTTDYKVKLIATPNPGPSTANFQYDDERGPLGEGTYTVTKNADGTFTEKWEPAVGNSVDAFEESGVSQTRWIDANKKDSKAMFMSRLNGRLIEAMVEDMVYEEQLKYLPSSATENDKKKLREEVISGIVVLETDDKRFKGKFAGFVDEKAAKKYTKKWTPREPSGNHDSKKAYNGPEFGNSDRLVDYYDGKSREDTPGHIGIIREGLFDHGLEAANVIIREAAGAETNLGAENAKAVKQYQEK